MPLNFRLCTAINLLVCVCVLSLVCISPTTSANNTQPDIRELDRMFTTRYERAQLDALRRRLGAGATIDINAAATVSNAPATIEMQGIMQRDNGGNVVWLNGQSTLNSNTIDQNIRVTGKPQALRGATISSDGKTARLKPGQVWQPGTGEIDEVYKTKVSAPVTKGAAEIAADVQTEIIEKVLPKPILAKPEAAQSKP